MPAAPPQPATRRVWFAALLLALSAAGMVLGYVAARTSAGDGPIGSAATPEGRAGEVRVFANEVVQLTDTFLARLRASEPGSDAFDRWLEQEYRPALNDLRRRMVESPVTEPPMAAMLSALEHVAAMASEPQRPELRIRATEAVLEATTRIPGATDGLDSD